jgi:hypothetical protein
MSRICIEKRPSTHKTSKIAHERKQLRKKKTKGVDGFPNSSSALFFFGH